MQRFLRINVMRAGRLIDDRYVMGDVTIGGHALIVIENGRPVLHVNTDVTGELALDGRRPCALAALESEGAPEEDGWRLTLSEQARGWVRLGPLTFYLQMEARPPPAPVTLPPGTRAGLASGLEASFIAILLAVLSMEGLGIYALHGHPLVEADDPIAEPDAEVGRLALPPPEPPRIVTASRRDRGRSRTTTLRQGGSGKTWSRSQRDTHERIRHALDGLLGSDPIQDILGNPVSGDLARAMKNARAHPIATEGVIPQRQWSAGDDRPVGSDPLGFPQPGDAPARQMKWRSIHPPTVPGRGIFRSPVDSRRVPESFIRYLKRKMATLKICYERQLKQDATLHGKLDLGFVVTAEGRIEDVDAETDSLNSPPVLDCIRLLMRGWLVSPKPDADTQVTIPLIFTPAGS